MGELVPSDDEMLWLKFGCADGPRVRGGWSIVHKILSPEALHIWKRQLKGTVDGPRTVRFEYQQGSRGQSA